MKLNLWMFTKKGDNVNNRERILLTILFVTVIYTIPIFVNRTGNHNKTNIEITTENNSVNLIKRIEKIIQTKQPKLDPAITKPTSDAIVKYAKKYGFPPEFIVCLIDRESSFNTIATSSADCVGLMQINEKFHKDKLAKIGIKSDQLFHIDHNIHIGCMILRKYYNSTKSIGKALTKYVGGKHPSYVCNILSAYSDLTMKKR